MKKKDEARKKVEEIIKLSEQTLANAKQLLSEINDEEERKEKDKQSKKDTNK